ncbi:MAG: hypothetical protein WDN01_06610 [Rhizomicrobium sp.]
MLIFALRMLVAGRARCPLLHEEMDIAAGPLAMEFLAALSIFLMTLGNGSRRRLAVGPPPCHHRMPDEEAILCLVAAAQEDDEERLAAHLCWLVRSERQQAVRGSLRALADMATCAGLRLCSSEAANAGSAAAVRRMAHQ